MRSHTQYTPLLHTESGINGVDLTADPEHPGVLANLRVVEVDEDTGDPGGSWMIADLDKVRALQLISGLLKFIGSIDETVNTATDSELENI